MAANSTLMFTGFHPDSRNSSKVLRPPGGGSSDFFGLKEESKVEAGETKPVEVAEEKPVEGEAGQEKVNSAEMEKQAVVETIEPSEEAKTEAAASETVEEQEAAPTPPVEPEVRAVPAVGVALAPPLAGVRGRIPPGGHSSGGFW